MNKLNVYIIAIRPKTLTASIGPVLVGLSLAGTSAIREKLLIASIIILTALLLQISANLINDYYDFKNLVDTNSRIGPKRATSGGLLTISQVQNLYRTTIVLACLGGAFLVQYGGTTILLIGIISILAAYFYTAGPKPLSHFGLGEILALLFFGPVPVWGTYFIITNNISLLPALIGLGPGFIAWSLMGVNNMRDQVTDKKSGKYTLAVIFGSKISRLIPIAGIAFASVIPLGLAVYQNNLLLIIATFSFIPFLSHWKRLLNGPINADLNKSLVATGKYLLIYCITFSITLLV